MTKSEKSRLVNLMIEVDHDARIGHFIVAVKRSNGEKAKQFHPIEGSYTLRLDEPLSDANFWHNINRVEHWMHDKQYHTQR